MYEKHESYGVLKLSKQALQKGKILNSGPLYFSEIRLELIRTVPNRIGTVRNSSKRFRTSRKLGRYFQHIIMGFPLGNLLTERRKTKNRKI